MQEQTGHLSQDFFSIAGDDQYDATFVSAHADFFVDLYSSQFAFQIGAY